MAFANGQFPDSALTPIIGSRLSVEAAGSWLMTNGPQANGLRPNGYEQGYRDLHTQNVYWDEYQAGTGNLAAFPGTSNHGYGIAIDVAAPWMREWLDEHGANFGWKKTEAFSEWWHMNYVWVGHHWPKPFVPLAQHDRGPRVVKLTKRLAYIERPDTHAHYLDRSYIQYRKDVVVAVRRFQKDHHLVVDGIAGQQTVHMITAVFHRQYEHRHGGHTKFHGTLFNQDRLLIFENGQVKTHHPTRGQFARDVLVGLGAPVTTHNIVAFMAWMQAEGDAARWNPLNCTQTEPNSTDFNWVHVQNYTAYSWGVKATVHTLLWGTQHHEHGYGEIVHCMRKNRPAATTLKKVEASAWGTGGGASRVLAIDGWEKLMSDEYLHHRIVS